MAEKQNGRGAIRKAIEQAETVPPKPANDPSGPDAPAIRVSGGALVMRPDGLFKTSDEHGSLPISGPFDVLSQTRDDEATVWGLMLRFRDPDGVVQHIVVRRDLFSGDGGELRNVLARRGLYVNPSNGARGLLAEYLSRVSTDKRALIVVRTGWHRINGKSVFVLPGRTFGSPSVEVIYQPAMNDASLFNTAGLLADWRSSVSARCVGNSRLLLAVSAAFAGPLLDIVGEEGGGLHFRGSSRVGKTTALRVAASVWGGQPGNGAAGYIRQWRATDNAMEGLALAQSDTLLPLDELGQADARGVGDTAYLLASGQGKARSDRSGGLRAPTRFRVLFLSTGELSLADKIAEGGLGRRVKAGQEVRLVDIPADAKKGMGLFEDIHASAEVEAFIQELRAATTQCYGTAAQAFLEYLVSEIASNERFADDGRAWMHDLVGTWLTSCPESGGQVRSVARRFALVAIAGELATRAGITEWDANDASEAAYACFRAWLAERGTSGAREDAQAVAQLRDFLMRHGDSRFQEWRDPDLGDTPHGAQPPSLRDETDPSPPPAAERFRTVNRAGWRRRKSNSQRDPEAWHYYLTAEGMKEALLGLDRRQAIDVLTKEGFIKPGNDGKTARSLTPPGHAKVRLYHVLPEIFNAEADG